MNVEGTEVAEAQLNALIERRASGRNEANRIEAFWAAADRRHRDKQERENREAWAAYYREMARVHSGLAAEHEAKAADMEDEAC